MLRNYGSIEKYKHDILGMNSRLDELLAGFLLLRLKDLDKENLYRNKLAHIYKQELAAIQDICLPADISNGQQVWHLFVIRTQQRNELAGFLKAKGIQTILHPRRGYF
jgi:dTDP-3-amino-3,4,6-trideoxy-alpha-D-glucose transaminase